jgi:hypothetical protein
MMQPIRAVVYPRVSQIGGQPDSYCLSLIMWAVMTRHIPTSLLKITVYHRSHYERQKLEMVEKKVSLIRGRVEKVGVL